MSLCVKKSMAAMVGLAICSAAQAATMSYYIDFGATSTTTSGPTWNNINDGSLHSLVDSSGASTTQTIQTSAWGGYGTSGMGGMTGTAATAFGGAFGNAASDFIYDGNFADLARITLGNLDTSLKYTLTIFASRNGGGNRTGDYTATGANSASGSLNASYNTANVLVLSDVVPTAGKTIALTVAKNTLNDQNFVYVNALRIDAVPVPEPAAIGIVGLVSLACLKRRRA